MQMQDLEGSATSCSREPRSGGLRADTRSKITGSYPKPYLSKPWAEQGLNLTLRSWAQLLKKSSSRGFQMQERRGRRDVFLLGAKQLERKSDVPTPKARLC